MARLGTTWHDLARRRYAVVILNLTLLPPVLVYLNHKAYASGGYTGSAQSFYIAVDDSNISNFNATLYGAGQYYGCSVQSQEPTFEFVNFNFGTQTIQNGQWGTFDLKYLGNDIYQYISDSDIITGIAEYINGWHSCNDANHVLIALANVNDENVNNEFVNAVSEGAGTNWADVTNELANWVSSKNYPNDNTGVDASTDFEPNMCPENCVDYAELWVSQFAQADNTSSMLAYGGSADGCVNSALYYYPNASINLSCNDGYNAIALFQLMTADGYGIVEPQQYNQNISYVCDWPTNNPCFYLEPQAIEYSNILNVGYQAYGSLPPLEITMTEMEACAQQNNCQSTDNSGPEAWGQMWDALSYGNNEVASWNIYFMDYYSCGTDMGWLE
jgi:hypothetical protein